jgi:membrane-bound lytic murein transglycosylase B
MTQVIQNDLAAVNQKGDTDHIQAELNTTSDMACQEQILAGREFMKQYHDTFQGLAQRAGAETAVRHCGYRAKIEWQSIVIHRA